jgi:16S rRNA (guanine527-N7)-methyltransferase
VSDEPLLEVLREAQRTGMVGAGPVEELALHARWFVASLPDGALEIVDLGSGAGLPGLVIAHDRPDVRVVLVDRRAKRSDFCRRMVRRLGWQDRVEVVTADVARLVRDPSWQGRFDVVVSRGCAAPIVTAAWASALARPGGRVVISEPPPDRPDRWDDDALDRLGLVRLGRSGAVAVFERR